MDYVCNSCRVRQPGTPGAVCSDCGKPLVVDELSKNDAVRLKTLILGKRNV